MSESEAAALICHVGKRMYDRNYVAANDGNISIKIGDDAVLCTPTGVSKGFMTPEMLCKVNLKGEKTGGRLNPSSEIKMHLRVYRENAQVMAVTHAHPVIATSYAIAGIELDLALLPEAIVNLGRVPIAKYATPGTEEVPESIAPFCLSHNAVLLANHGALTWGGDILEAFHRMESLEHYASMLLTTTRVLGSYNQLSCEQVETLIALRTQMGIKGGGVPTCGLSVSPHFEIQNPLSAVDEIVQKVTAKILEQLKV